jgi:hypothetical protein
MEAAVSEALKKTRRPTPNEIWDFAVKVQPIYKLLDWKWAQGGRLSVPTVSAIVTTIDILVECSDKSEIGGCCRTGGLTVDMSIDDDDPDATEPIILFKLESRSPYTQ